MPAHTDQQTLPYTPRQLYDLVADIERYPEFLPWCRAARILKREDHTLLAELVVAFSHFSESYTSRVSLHPPVDASAACSIKAEMVSGPFEYLINEWIFIPTAEGQTRLDFLIDFQFRSKMLDRMVGGLFGKAFTRMSDAFRKRAESLYGRKD